MSKRLASQHGVLAFQLLSKNAQDNGSQRMASECLGFRLVVQEQNDPKINRRWSGVGEKRGHSFFFPTKVDLQGFAHSLPTAVVFPE